MEWISTEKQPPPLGDQILAVFFLAEFDYSIIPIRYLGEDFHPRIVYRIPIPEIPQEIT